MHPPSKLLPAVEEEEVEAQAPAADQTGMAEATEDKVEEAVPIRTHQRVLSKEVLRT
jgi:hypothetical protein